MDITRIALLSVVALLLLPATAHAQGKAAHKDAYLYFVWRTVIKGAFWCRFGLRNMGVTHAGDDFENAGHHHLLIDVNSPLESNEPIPQDKNHLHFGAGQTEARIELPPGKHTLQLVLGDAKHYPTSPTSAKGVRSMSALGHERTFCDATVMSALPPKADMCGATRDATQSPVPKKPGVSLDIIAFCTERSGRPYVVYLT